MGGETSLPAPLPSGEGSHAVASHIVPLWDTVRREAGHNKQAFAETPSTSF
jgi:hypothetical protein